MQESEDELSERVQSFIALDITVCKMLCVSCMLIKDDESALELFRRIRSHLKMSEDRVKLFDTEFFLNYIKDLLEILNGLSSNPLTNEFKETVQDTYEVFLYNKSSLSMLLYDSYNEYTLDKKRKNYWLN